METQTAVLIIGAGPVGLTLANLLTSQGVACRIVTQEAAQRPLEQSRAEGNHGRTLALYERLGVLEEAFGQGRPLHGAILHDRECQLGRIVLDSPDSYYPGALILGQARVERILEARLKKADVLLERGLELSKVETTETGVKAILQSENGDLQTCFARYLVGCDGAHSATRKQAGATFAGEASTIQYALADVEVEFPGEPFDDDLHIWLSPLMILGRLEGKTWKVAAPTDPAEPLDENPESVIAAIQKKWEQNGVKAKIHSPRWTSVFRISTRRVDRMRLGPIFLAGDAAHVHSPMGGQGMNEGMQDALNLAWKLATVLRDGTREALLDTYDEERQPIVADVLKDTAQMTRLMEMPDSSLAKLRNLALSVATHLEPLQPVIREQFSGASRNLRKSAIVSEPEGTDFLAHAPMPGDRAPDAGGIFADDVPESRRLFTLWKGLFQHQLLLFTGQGENEPGRLALSGLAQEIEAQYGGRLQAWVVTRSGRGRDNFYLDSTGELHTRFGIKKEGLFLIRPDGFIAYRSSKTDRTELERFLREAYGWQG